MTSQNTTYERSKKSNSCSELGNTEVVPDKNTSIEKSSSLPTSLTDDWKTKTSDCLSNYSNFPSVDSTSTNSLKLVQNCGPECTITQRIVDRLLARMIHLENERSELLAANRSWAVQFQMMQENQKKKITSLEEELKEAKETNKDTVNNSEEKNSRTVETESQDKFSLLSHQAAVYKEDFLEERKARVRAHAQIEALKNELKREKKSRAKLSSLLQQPKAYEALPVIGN